MNSFITEASSVVHFYTTVQWIWSTGSCKLLRTNALCVVGEGKGREWGWEGGNEWVCMSPVTSSMWQVKMMPQKRWTRCGRTLKWQRWSSNRLLWPSRLQLTGNDNNNNDNCISSDDDNTERHSRTIPSLCCKLSLTRMLKWQGGNSVQITCNISGPYHVQLFHVFRRDSSAVESNRVEITFIVVVSHWLKPLSWLTNVGVESKSEKTTDGELEKMPQTWTRSRTWKFKPQARLEPSL